MDHLIPVGAAVRIDAQTSAENVSGTIAGYGTFARDGKTYPCYIVRLDVGFWGWSYTVYTEMMVVHPDNIEELQCQNQRL